MYTLKGKYGVVIGVAFARVCLPSGYPPPTSIVVASDLSSERLSNVALPETLGQVNAQQRRGNTRGVCAWIMHQQTVTRLQCNSAVQRPAREWDRSPFPSHARARAFNLPLFNNSATPRISINARYRRTPAVIHRIGRVPLYPVTTRLLPNKKTGERDFSSRWIWL